MTRIQIAAAILGAAASSEALGLAWIALRQRSRPQTAVRLSVRAPALDYILGVAIALTYCAAAWASLPTVRGWAFGASPLKAVALAAAIAAGVFEELLFRGLLMDALQRRGVAAPWQIAISGVAFGLAHAVWGLGRPATALAPILWTSVLGMALAALYARNRSLGPVILSHALIDAVIEPGLLLSVLA